MVARLHDAGTAYWFGTQQAARTLLYYLLGDINNHTSPPSTPAANTYLLDHTLGLFEQPGRTFLGFWIGRSELWAKPSTQTITCALTA